MNRGKDSIIGLAIGDALGVPVEFLSREQLALKPITDMIGYGTHNQPAGTWSDDTSLTLCLVDMLTKAYCIETLADNFGKWLTEGEFTAHGEVFDVGITTSIAINNIIDGIDPILAGGEDEGNNGNGSLMRILPLAFFIKDDWIVSRFTYVNEVSSLTHRHRRSVIGCFIYVEYVIQLLNGENKIDAYTKMQSVIKDFFHMEDDLKELEHYSRIIENNIYDYDINEIKSSGYVVHTLEASLWCIINTNTFSEAVLKAVNLGNDTDTTGAVTGGLAGIIYGIEGIPEEWLIILANRSYIENICDKFDLKVKMWI